MPPLARNSCLFVSIRGWNSRSRIRLHWRDSRVEFKLYEWKPKPDEPPRGVTNRSLIIRHFRRRTGRSRPVLCCAPSINFFLLFGLGRWTLQCWMLNVGFPRTCKELGGPKKMKTTFPFVLSVSSVLSPLPVALAPSCTYLQKLAPTCRKKLIFTPVL